VPTEVAFATKGELAWQQIEAALAAGYPRGTVLADAGYGDETAWREQLAANGLSYAVGVRPATTVWWGAHRPAPLPERTSGVGRPRSRLRRDAAHQPLAVAALAGALPAGSYRTLTWRQGAAEPLTSRFARVRVQAAHRDRQRPEEWLVIEWPSGAPEPTHYWLSNLPAQIGWQAMVNLLMGRWRIERDYQELKQELGLGHFEGRNWRGFHHHASLCVAAYGFLMIERLSGAKKNSARFKTPALPAAFRPRGAGADAAPSAVVDRHLPLPPRPRHPQNPSALSMLRPQAVTTQPLLTQ
jgi:SRSO17 transposase